jgi:hypothetical protein
MSRVSGALGEGRRPRRGRDFRVAGSRGWRDVQTGAWCSYGCPP